MKTERATMPWASAASEELPGLRRAITAQLRDPAVQPATAAMMGELLHRLDAFLSPPSMCNLELPAAPAGRVPSLVESAVSLQTVSGRLREQLLTMGEGDSGRSTLQSMAQVIDNYLAMRGEILARCASESAPA
jgi:hypothetical protein